MTISSQSRKAGPFIGNGVTVAFPFAFKVFAASDVYVVRATDTGTESVLTVGTHYSVTLNSNQNSNPGGTVTLGAALASNYKLVITSAVPNLQPVDITNNGGFYPKVINDALDRVTIMAQQLALDSSRAVKLPITSALTGDEFTAQLFDARDEAVDSAVAAAISATGAANSATSASASASTATTKASEASTSASGAAISATAASGSATAAAGSATTAGNSATTATTKAGEAASSATAAASSATASAGSATTATTKAGEATTAAAAAAGSQTAAASSASSAGTSATNASNSATSASNSATSATSSASAASTSASQAATSATNAANSATSAAGSATTASTAATTATGASSTAVTSASTATTQATNAATSATAAASSATSAASSAAAAAAALDSFDDRYLGAKTSNPTLDNDGNALMQGALYYRSTAPIGMKVYDGSQWIEASAAQQASLVTFEYVATAGQTSFSGNDANGVSLSYTVGNVLVSVNGVRLRPGDDFTASTGTSIVLASAASVGDEILVDAFKTFDVANTYTQAQVDGLLASKQAASNVLTTYAATGVEFRNRIINGDMRIDQRNAGASAAVVGGSPKYGPDRFQLDLSTSTGVALSIQQVSDAPADFGKSLKVTVTTSGSTSAGNYSYVRQQIEGYNFADLNFGTANARTFTLSFWVKSSLTGTFGGYLGAALNARFRTFSYTINSANTWEYKTVTVSGDTAGTWDTTNGVGLQVAWSMSCGSTYQGATGSWGSSLLLGATGQVNVTETNGATFYITGVQLEAGTVASPFERRDYGRELMMCQRYYEVVGNGASGTLNSGNAGTVSFTTFWKVTKRAGPTVGVGFGAVQGADIASAVTYQGGIGAGAWYFPQGVTASAEL